MQRATIEELPRMIEHILWRDARTDDPSVLEEKIADKYLQIYACDSSVDKILFEQEVEILERRLEFSLLFKYGMNQELTDEINFIVRKFMQQEVECRLNELL